MLPVGARPPRSTPSRPSELARGFNALGDPVRLRVLSLLAAAPAGEVCVCDFVEPIGKSQATISHHLKILADAGLVHGDRRGKWVWYSLDRAPAGRPAKRHRTLISSRGGASGGMDAVGDRVDAAGQEICCDDVGVGFAAGGRIGNGPMQPLLRVWPADVRWPGHKR